MMPSSAPTLSNDAFLADARNNMVDSQIRPNRVSDPRILDSMRALPRHLFLPPAQLALAYADQAVPLGGGRVLLEPMALARLLQAAVPLASEKALVVGAGGGYSAALLASLGLTVTALEEPGALFDLAKTALAEVAPSVRLVSGPLPAGWPADAPYDLILIDGAVPEIPATLAGQLNPDTGRLLTIVASHTTGSRTTSLAVQAEPTPAGISVRALFDCPCAVLPSFAVAPAFVF